MPDTQRPASARQRALRKLGLERPIDLALHLPLRYEDETRLLSLAEAARCVSDEPVQFEATVTHQEVALRGKRQLLVTVQDGDVQCLLRFFNFYPSQRKQMAVGERLRVRGPLRGGFGGLHMMHPVVRAAGGPLADALTPVYPTTAGLSQPVLRKAVQAGLQEADLRETIPQELLAGAGAWHHWSLKQALVFLHHPAPDVSLAELEDHTHPAWQRLKAEELLALQLSQAQVRQQRQQLRGPALMAGAGDLPDQLLAALPFRLTAAQRRVSEEIAADLAGPLPMRRLLQGDVGSGKTVVAALAACRALAAGWQCVLMAPTEILARQHFERLAEWLTPLLAPLGKQVAWLAGQQKKSARKQMLQAIADGSAALVIGTHAVIQDEVRFDRLGLAVIDEQHRFGVGQRLRLRQMQDDGTQPHLLMMSATPIPRTLAMSYYADLDVSTIDELPPGRWPVTTRLVSGRRRAEVVERLRRWLATGAQAYWVCPLIEESEALDLRHATQAHEELVAALPGLRVGLLHARLPADEKKAVMAGFVAGDVALLVSTTVIEVGVDVPGASLMVIEHAERFGLSQLHQLRGRVGRGAAASICVLLYGAPDGGRLSDTARQRLKAMVETADGFEIARRDLAIRGPGEFMGARQSGTPLLRFADLAEDEALLAWAREAAPVMLARHPGQAARHVARWLGTRMEYLKA
ncbi:MAG: ATP-dependent DNA helicase RecG [Ottowia sp.]|nr:ATP-dependent DNA helicase RecG [Ottowia sp.]